MHLQHPSLITTTSAAGVIIFFLLPTSIYSVLLNAKFERKNTLIGNMQLRPQGLSFPFPGVEQDFIHCTVYPHPRFWDTCDQTRVQGLSLSPAPGKGKERDPGNKVGKDGVVV